MVEVDNIGILDDPEAYSRDWYQRAFNITRRYIDSFSRYIELGLDLGGRYIMFKPSSIVYLGIGGSAIAGDVASSIIEEIKIHVHRDYTPIKISSDKLIIAVSYSGDSAEVFPTLLQNIDSNPNIIVVTSGGRLKKLAEKKNLPIVLLEPGIPPRYSFPHTFGAILGILESLDIKVENLHDSIGDVRRFHEKLDYNIPTRDNLAKNTATRIYGRTPIIYAYGRTLPIAYRFKCQLNENSKIFAHLSELPEALHNDIEALDEDSILIAPRISHYDNHVEGVYRALSRYLGDRYIELKLDGGVLIEEVLSMLLLVDYISLYLAVLRDVDPMVLLAIPKLKQENKAYEEILRSVDEKLEAW